MRNRNHRWWALLILLGWIVPQSTALGWSLHIALEGHDAPHHHAEPGHSHPPGQDHRHEHSEGSEPSCDHLAHRVGLAALAETLAHGHPHDDSDTAPDHEHEATAKSAQPTAHGKVPTSAPCAGHEPAPSPAASGLGGELPRRRGPPPPLFTTHCSLLL